MLLNRHPSRSVCGHRAGLRGNFHIHRSVGAFSITQHFSRIPGSSLGIGPSRHAFANAISGIFDGSALEFGRYVISIDIRNDDRPPPFRSTLATNLPLKNRRIANPNARAPEGLVAIQVASQLTVGRPRRHGPLSDEPQFPSGREMGCDRHILHKV